MSAWAVMMSCLMMMSTSCYAFSSPASTSNLFRPESHSSSAAATAKSNSFNHNQQHQNQCHVRSRRGHIKPSFSLFAASGDTSSSGSISTTKEANGEAEQLNQLKKENELLQQRLKLLQIQNDELLLKQQQNSKQDMSSTTDYGASYNTNGKKKRECLCLEI